MKIEKKMFARHPNFDETFKPWVMIVDDDYRVGKSTLRVLNGKGWECYGASTAERALATERPADVILLDWDPYGPEVLAKTKKPVVVYTARAAEVREMHPELIVLQKPCDPDEICAALTKAVTK